MYSATPDAIAVPDYSSLSIIRVIPVPTAFLALTASVIPRKKRPLIRERR
ncbi:MULTISPECIES: hypothetical protein [Calothrix]|uniref:Uncharacterized protein n=2 Tax=Calothrix TaxID=1186 RepID=A0ABR8A8P8_9CYAN|nr:MULTISPECIES: hypothetical protein [Calothrix]MBD2196209.1 hypothetical protein [Calothrix parietina FACHB-288]MBD2204012.1 hypothetical protein [Calothrix sp. FACHB-168]MBD2218203.1 hypothetical protein [Calothrix sp. FACHB-1219]MBD2224862.1 hypothetical protein [Calothrix anomala FACHB-343]